MKYLFLLLGVLFSSCGVSIKTNFQEKKDKLSIENKVVFLDVHHKVPEGAKKIGEGKFGDTGLSVDCEFNSNLIKARKIARENGANIIKIIKVNNPDLLSSCYRMKIEFYFYEGNVQDLPQYQLRVIN